MNSAFTHPESIWIVTLATTTLNLCSVAIMFLFLKNPMLSAAATQSMRLSRSRGLPVSVDGALIYVPRTAQLSELYQRSVVVAVLMTLLLSLTSSWYVVVASMVVVPALMYLQLLIADHAYSRDLERDLPQAVERLASYMSSGNGFPVALRKTIGGLEYGPLRDEWMFLLEAQGRTLGVGVIATPKLVIAALEAQTPSGRHRDFLSHLRVAVDQPIQALVERCRTAYEAMQASQERAQKSAAMTAQVRSTSWAIGFAAAAMLIYLGLSNLDRAIVAFSIPFIGPLVATGIVGGFVGVFVGPVLLTSDDVEY